MFDNSSWRVVANVPRSFGREGTRRGRRNAPAWLRSATWLRSAARLTIDAFMVGGKAAIDAPLQSPPASRRRLHGGLMHELEQ
jgi:hypothetical protein